MLDGIYNDGTYAAHHPTWHAEDSSWKAAHLFSILDQDTLATMSHSVARVAEIGCGYGGVLAALCRLLEAHGIPCEGTGFDVSSHAIQVARERNPGFDFRQCDFWDATERYDLGLIVDVLEHLEEPLDLLVNAARRFRWLLFHVPLDENLYNRVRHGKSYRQWAAEESGHIHLYTMHGALGLLRSADLRVVAWKYTPWGLELYERVCSGRSAPVVRALRAVGMRCCPNLSVRVVGGASFAALCMPASSDRV